MSGIARLFLERGPPGHRLRPARHREHRARCASSAPTIAIGHDAANVGDADTLVVTGALWQDNPEYQLALERGLPVLHRSQALAWLISGHRLVAVAGAHGKTTSTGMIVTGLLELGADPSFVNGGVIEALGVSSASGDERALRRRGRRVRRLVPALRHRGRAHHERRRRPPRPLRLARGVRATPSSTSPTRRSELVVVSSATTPAPSRVTAAPRRTSASSPSARPADADVRVHSIEHRRARARSPSTTQGDELPARRCAIPGAPQRHQRGRRLRRARRPRLRPRADPSRAHRARSAAPTVASSCTAPCGGVQRLRRLRPPPDRGRRRPADRPHRRRRRPHHRRAPAAPVQPHPTDRGGVRRGARAATPTTPSCSTSTARARTRSPGSPARSSPSASPTPSHVAFVPDWQEAADYTARHRPRRRLRDHARLRRRLPHRPAAARVARARSARIGRRRA